MADGRWQGRKPHWQVCTMEPGQENAEDEGVLEREDSEIGAREGGEWTRSLDAVGPSWASQGRGVTQRDFTSSAGSIRQE